MRNINCVPTELDPNNYMIFYRRATVYLAMGKSKSALPDLDVVLSLKPDFNAVCCCSLASLTFFALWWYVYQLGLEKKVEHVSSL